MICLLVLRELCALRFSNDNAMIFSAGINADNRFTTIDIWAVARSTSSPSLHCFTAIVVFALTSPSLLPGILIAMIFVRLHVCLRACFCACLFACFPHYSLLSSLDFALASLLTQLAAPRSLLVSCFSLSLLLSRFFPLHPSSKNRGFNDFLLFLGCGKKRGMWGRARVREKRRGRGRRGERMGAVEQGSARARANR